MSIFFVHFSKYFNLLSGIHFNETKYLLINYFLLGIRMGEYSVDESPNSSVEIQDLTFNLTDLHRPIIFRFSQSPGEAVSLCPLVETKEQREDLP